MTTDVIYEERGSDWSQQDLVVGQLDGCSVTRPFLSLGRVWLVRLAEVYYYNACKLFK